ncbi:MAG: alpha/beta fold hydrolase [Burkholderiales bacterium]
MANIKVNGLNVEYRQTGSGRDLVLLHSLLTDMTVFAAVEPALAGTRRLTLFNLPGYGASTAADARSIEDYADHVAAVIAALNLPGASDVFGNGFGGFVTVALAARHGGKFDRLVIADALAEFPPSAKAPFQSMAGRVETEGMGAVLDAAIARMFPAAFVAAHPQIIAERKAALAKADAPAFARACRALAALDFAPVLGKIKNRTLVTVGELDATTPPAGAAQLAAGIAGAQYRPLANCGHCPMLEQPAALVSLLDQFLG